MSQPAARNDYAKGEVFLDTEVGEPSYRQCLHWLIEGSPADGPATFDYWARGNYTRRLLFNRARGLRPLLVEVQNTEQMRWAYRRLALLGLPVDFLYTGGITGPQRLLHAVPLRDDSLLDSGWGYIGTLSQLGDEHWLQLIGTARLMPQDVLQWLTAEAAAEFERGSLFVAPSELVGIPACAARERLAPLADVSGGTPLAERDDAAKVLFALELPFVDGLSAEDFARLLRDESHSLTDFRVAFRTVCTESAASERGTAEAVERLRYEVREIIRSARFQQLRHLIRSLKGRLRTFQASMGVLAAAGAIYARDPFAGTAVLAGAGKVLHDLWKKARQITPDLSGHRFRLFWKLGTSRLTVSPQPKGAWVARARLETAKKIDPHHWLCPPTAGLQLAFVRKTAGKE
jgi:hypothetical protein